MKWRKIQPPAKTGLITLKQARALWRSLNKKKAVRRINLFAGPSAGKSTLSAWLFAKMKMEGHEVEHVSEYVKAWAFIGRPPTSWDQIYIFGKQMHKEDIVLRRPANSIVITESPIFLSACYAEKYGAPGKKHILALIKEFERAYPSLNIFIDRKGMKYNKNGRFQNYKQALEMDKVIRNALDKHKVDYHVISYDDLDGLEALAKEAVK